MSIGVGLFAHLSADAGVSALVADRIYPLVLPDQPTLPAVTYQRMSDVRHTVQSGAPLTNPRYRLIAWSDDYDTADQLAAALALALEGWRDTGNRVISALVDDESEDREAETGLYRRDVEVLMWS